MICLFCIAEMRGWVVVEENFLGTVGRLDCLMCLKSTADNLIPLELPLPNLTLPQMGSVKLYGELDNA